MEKRKVVTVMVPAVASSMRDLVRGIADYAAEAGDWHLVLHLWGHVNAASAEWINRGDGIVFESPLSTSVVRSPEWRIPAVAVQVPALGARHPLVTTDYRAVGRMAADYFLEKGLPHLAYLGYRNDEESEAGFRERAREAGVPVETYGLGGEQPELDERARKNVLAWLHSLAPPVGILLREDFVAQKIIDWIPRDWLPERIALLGTGNDSIICEITRPTLSSVDRGARRVGWQAAAWLDRIMKGEKMPPQILRLPPSHIAERQSTGLRYTPDILVTRAVRMIEKNLSNPLTTDALCARLGLSRRTLERRFHAALGCSVLKHRWHLQLEKARRLLATTSEPMSHIAEQCGYGNQQRFAESFRRAVGVAPSRYRRESKHP